MKKILILLFLSLNLSANTSTSVYQAYDHISVSGYLEVRLARDFKHIGSDKIHYAGSACYIDFNDVLRFLSKDSSNKRGLVQIFNNAQDRAKDYFRCPTGSLSFIDLHTLQSIETRELGQRPIKILEQIDADKAQALEIIENL